MPKRRSLWKRDTPCLVCDATMINYQFMSKSQQIIYDEWMISHTQSVSDYDEYPDVLKTTICPGCLMASNEFSFGVDDYKYFTRSPNRNDQMKQMFVKTMNERFHVLANEFGRFEQESALLDRMNKRPENTRSRATFQKIWSQRDKLGVPFFTLMFQEPRDYVTALACFAVDRYCQMVRIAYNNDIEPPGGWGYDKLKTAIETHFTGKVSEMKSPETRFYFIGSNFLQSIQFIQELDKIVAEGDRERHKSLIEEYWQEAYKALQFSYDQEDITSIPLELKEGGMNLLMTKLHFRFGNQEAGIKTLKYAKHYADRKLKKISSNNQQNYYNEVDALYKKQSSAT